MLEIEYLYGIHSTATGYTLRCIITGSIHSRPIHRAAFEVPFRGHGIKAFYKASNGSMIYSKSIKDLKWSNYRKVFEL